MPPPSSLPNLSPVSDRMSADVGIEAADDVAEVGAAMAWRMVKHRHPAATLHLRYALEGRSGRHWARFSDREQAAIRTRVDGDLEVGSD